MNRNTQIIPVRNQLSPVRKQPSMRHGYHLTPREFQTSDYRQNFQTTAQAIAEMEQKREHLRVRIACGARILPCTNT